MTGSEKNTHFKGKTALDHVTEARQKGKIVASEIHGEDLSGYFNAISSSVKETSLLILLLQIFFSESPLFVPFLLSWLIWKTGSSAILGWRRLERLHHLIEEERWEIEHHRPQEKEELTALYSAKGFCGKQLEEVVDVLMADDNRLLQVMLEEELGLNLESFEHPLKQAAGSAIGVVCAATLLGLALFFLPFWGTALLSSILIASATGMTAFFEKNRTLPALIWNLSLALLTGGAAYFLKTLFL